MHLRSCICATALGAVALASTTPAAHAQAAPAKWADTIAAEIDAATLAGDTARLHAAESMAERVATAFPNDGLILHYQAYALYREQEAAQGGTIDAARLERANRLLERSLATHPLPETHMLISFLDGMLIGADPSRAMELGAASSQSQAKAMALGPQNPRVWLLAGISAMFTPPEYGGGLDRAADDLKRSIAFFDKDAPKPGEPSWGRAEAHVWLGQVLAKQGDKPAAGAEYQKALDIAPSYAFAKRLAASVK